MNGINFERDEYMNLAKELMLKRAAVMLLGLLLLSDAVATAQSLPTKEELVAIEQAQVNESGQSFPATHGRKLNSRQ